MRGVWRVYSGSVIAFGSVLLISGLGLGSLVPSLGAESKEPKAYWGSLMSPGNFTNLYCCCRAISPDGKTLSQTRYWLLGSRIRLLQEKLVTNVPVMSLTDAPADLWTRVELVSEVVKNQHGVFTRQRPDQNWAERARELRTTLEQRSPKGVVFLVSPDNWSPLKGGEAQFHDYRFVVDDELFEMGQTTNTPSGFAELSMRLPDHLGQTNRFLKILYDPSTRLKLQEQEWAADRLVRDCFWKTNEWLDPQQFVVTEADLYKQFPSGTKLGVVGVRLKAAERGPYVIEEVFTNAPAAEAGLQVGDIVLAVDGRNTERMSLRELVDAIRGDPCSTVTLKIKKAHNGEKTNVVLHRRLLIHPLDSTNH